MKLISTKEKYENSIENIIQDYENKLLINNNNYDNNTVNITNS